jgi:hypothetical protein
MKELDFSIVKRVNWTACIIVIIIIIITAIGLLTGGSGYQHILQNVIVPAVQMLYPDGIIHLQQDHSSIHDSRTSTTAG